MIQEKVYDINKMVEFAPGAVLNEIMWKKDTGSITLSWYDAGTITTSKLSPFETSLILLEGSVTITCDDQVISIIGLQTVIIHAHKQYTIAATERSKLLTVVIKSGYE